MRSNDQNNPSPANLADQGATEAAMRFAGDGNNGALIRAHDWAKTPLGAFTA
ncbi:hypothetical protein [Sphingomonas sp. M1-B02]|uniref:hypothetical protein n=1 Tax=Sphingomonas sp. M1-B02 TaxID=3114300 RepID=UPI00223F8A77|nr:hypothetical protein [Sphingomonas sp. S6-11]UZK67668.1 hypothetical protein OKW87_07520 [Sphingomonas sp. S6-11]